MANGYMPRADLEARRWMNRFAKQIASNPVEYHLTADQVTMVADAVAAFSTALYTALAPESRTRIAVMNKDTLRTQAEAAIRPIYTQIKLNPAISDTLRSEAGIRPVNPSRSRIPKPNSRPRLSVRDGGNGLQILSYADCNSPYRVAKPKGAIGLQVVRYIGDARPTSINQMQYFQTFTKKANRITYYQSNDLKMVTYMGRWINRKGETGPWSNPVSIRIASQAMPIQQLQAA